MFWILLNKGGLGPPVSDVKQRLTQRVGLLAATFATLNEKATAAKASHRDGFHETFQTSRRN
jgi:hypothetical protein